MVAIGVGDCEKGAQLEGGTGKKLNLHLWFIGVGVSGVVGVVGVRTPKKSAHNTVFQAQLYLICLQNF